MALSFLKKFKEGVVDIFDANTQADQQRRLNSGQAQWYQDQQRQQGNMRPANNLFGQVAPSAGRLVNTARAGVGGLYGLGKVGAASVFGSDDDYRTTLTDVVNTMNKDLSPTGGFGGVGTFFDSPEQAAQSNPSMIGKKIVGGGLGVAGELAPIPALRAVKGGSTLIKGAKVAGMSGGANVVADVGSQLIEKGRVDPKRTAIAGATGALTGGALSFGGNAVNRAMPKNLRRNKLINEADELSEDITGNLGSSVDNITTKEPSYVRKRPSTIEEKRIQTRLGIDQPIGKKSTSLPQVKFKAAQRLAKENPPAYQRQGASALRQQAIRAVQQGNANEATDIIRATQDLPSDITPKTRAVIESIRSKNAPPIEEGTPNTDTSLVKGEASKAPASMEDEFKAAASQNRSQASKGNVGNYQYSPPAKGASGTQYTDYLVDKYIGGDSGKPRVRAKYQPSRISTSAQELYRGRVVDPLRDAVNELLQKGITSSNPIIAGALNAPTLASNRFGLKDSIRTVLRAQKGQQENAGRVIRKITNDMGKDLAPESLERIDRVFEQPDYLARAYGGDGTKISLEQLNPSERQAVETMVDINKLRNDINLEIGNITPELHARFADGMHSPRIYDIEVQASGGNPNLLDTNVSKKRVNVNDVSEDIFAKREASPIMRSMIRAEIALRDKATFDAMKGLKDAGLILPNAPNKSFSKLEGKRYGAFNGSYIYNPVRSELDNNIAYNTRGGQAVGELVQAYQSTPLGTLDRFFKSTKTTLAPATFLGNVVSNPVAFNPASGVNTLTQAKNMAKAGVKVAKDARGDFDKSLYEARKLGVGAGDTGKQLTGDKRQELQVTAKNSNNPYKWAGSVYGGVDQTAQVALYDELIARGLSPETAARRVMAGTQDYEGVGRLFQNMADTPVLGKPFARFAPEFARLVKNNVIYNPVGTTAKVGAVGAAASGLSKLAGETDEERQARENAVGQTQIPTSLLPGVETNVPLNFAIPDKIGGIDLPGEGSAVNIARVTGFNNPMEPGGSAEGAVVRSLNPMADLTQKDAQGNDVIRPNQAVSSLTFRPIADQIANRDFMGRQITDPTNKTYIEGVGEKGKKFAGQPSGKEQLDSRLQTLAANYIPGFNEANAIYSASKNQKDYYGKDRTLAQGIARAFGFKAESNNPEARKGRLDKQEFFEGKVENTNKWLRENPDLKDAYASLTSNTRTRDTNTKTRDLIGPEKWSIIKGDISGRLFGRIRAEALEANKKNGQPVDPLFQLNSPERAAEIIELRSRPTGDDIEREDILRATTSWYAPFEKAERKYHEQNSKYFDKAPKGDNPAKTNPRVQAYLDIPYTEQTPLAKRYMEIRYGNEEKGIAPNEEAGKAFYKANADRLSQDFSAYKVAKLKEINAKRAMEGFPPIDQATYNNVTFGFDEDEIGAYAARSGGYGGGRGGPKSAGSAYKYAVDLNAGGEVAKPKVSVKGGSKTVSKKVSTKAPKVSIKKSKV